MEFYDVLKNRRSIRGYTPTPVPQDRLARICEAIRLAPTACNRQPFKFVFVDAAATDLRAAIHSCYPQPWLAAAPTVVLALGDRTEAWRRANGESAHTIDVAIAMEHLVLAAAAEGLGTCWICAFDRAKMHAALELDDQWDPVAITPLGFPSKAPGPFARKPIDEIVERVT